MASGQSYGDTLPDQVERLASLSDAQLDLLADVRELYRERAAIEREYAAKLQILAKKAAERKARKAATLVLGDEPTKTWDVNTVLSSTVDAAYAQVIGLVADGAQDHVKLADAFTNQVVNAIKLVEQRHEDDKKRQMVYFQKLVSERDKVYGERAKTKQKYDEECTEVESYRQKQGRASDDRHAERAAKQFEQQEIDMNNAKNIYLVSIATVNRIKAKFYDVDLPALENQFQRLQTALLNSLAALLVQAAALEDAHLDTLKQRVAGVATSAHAISPSADQDLFIDYNIRPFSAPADWTFEPCGVHYDTPDMVVDPAAKVFLQNKLAKTASKLAELEPVLDSKRSDVGSLTIHFEAYASDRTASPPDDSASRYLDAQHELAFFASSECILKAEIETISEALGGDVGSQKPHQFKSSSFSIPTHCGYCKSSIWGLSKQGKTCKLCGLSVHAKCELKVPADCGGSKGMHGNTGSVTGRSSISARPSSISTSSSRTSSISTPTPSSFVDSHSLASTDSFMTGRVIYDYTATSPFELSISEGTVVTILEDDDGSGWVKVDDGAGGKGLVPASYVNASDDTTPSNIGGTPSQGSGQYVRGIYDYAAQGPDEMSISAGQTIELSSGPNGGQNYASGWWEGVNAAGKKGIFPSNYVELI